MDLSELYIFKQKASYCITTVYKPVMQKKSHKRKIRLYKESTKEKHSHGKGKSEAPDIGTSIREINMLKSNGAINKPSNGEEIGAEWWCRVLYARRL